MQAIPAFLTLAVMPLTYSIAYGVVAGLVAYFIINGTNWLLDNVTSGAKSLPQWVAHVRQVSARILLPASCCMPCVLQTRSGGLPQRVLGAADATGRGRPTVRGQRVHLPCCWACTCAL